MTPLTVPLLMSSTPISPAPSHQTRPSSPFDNEVKPHRRLAAPPTSCCHAGETQAWRRRWRLGARRAALAAGGGAAPCVTLNTAAAAAAARIGFWFNLLRNVAAKRNHGKINISGAQTVSHKDATVAAPQLPLQWRYIWSADTPGS